MSEQGDDDPPNVEDLLGEEDDDPILYGLNDALPDSAPELSPRVAGVIAKGAVVFLAFVLILTLFSMADGGVITPGEETVPLSGETAEVELIGITDDGALEVEDVNEGIEFTVEMTDTTVPATDPAEINPSTYGYHTDDENYSSCLAQAGEDARTTVGEYEGETVTVDTSATGIQDGDTVGGYVYLDDGDTTMAMVLLQDGLATRDGETHPYTSTYDAYEDGAYVEGIGVWSCPSYVTPSAD